MIALVFFTAPPSNFPNFGFLGETKTNRERIEIRSFSVIRSIVTLLPSAKFYRPAFFHSKSDNDLEKNLLEKVADKKSIYLTRYSTKGETINVTISIFSLFFDYFILLFRRYIFLHISTKGSRDRERNVVGSIISESPHFRRKYFSPLPR